MCSLLQLSACSVLSLREPPPCFLGELHSRWGGPIYRCVGFWKLVGAKSCRHCPLAGLILAVSVFVEDLRELDYSVFHEFFGLSQGGMGT